MIRRILLTILMYIVPSGVQRTKVLKHFHVFGSIGDDVMIQTRKIPLYANDIYIGNNVRIASEVLFVTHDVIHNVLNKCYDFRFSERRGEITIGNNVFVGARTIILYNCNIGDNVIIGAGSVVTKNLSSGGVYAGVPCKFICSFESYVNNRMNMEK